MRERPPDEALAAWIESFADFSAAKRGMKEALRAVVESGSDVSAHARREIVGTLTALLEAFVAAGRVRDDVDTDDVLAAIGVVWNVPEGDPRSRRAACCGSSSTGCCGLPESAAAQRRRGRLVGGEEQLDRELMQR